MALSASGAQWLCACGLCPTSRALLETEVAHPCCANAGNDEGWHADDACGCSQHGISVGAAEPCAQTMPQAVAHWLPVETCAPATAAVSLQVRRTESPPLPPPATGPPVWLQTRNLLI